MIAVCSQVLGIVAFVFEGKWGRWIKPHTNVTQVLQRDLEPEQFQFYRKSTLAQITWMDARRKNLNEERVLVKEQYRRPGLEPEQTPV